MVQLTSDSYDEFQEETFNLLMRLNRRDKQQQRYQHGIDTSMVQTVTYSQASTSHHYPVSHIQMQTPHHQIQQTFTHVPHGLSQKQLQHSQQHFQQTFTQPHASAQQQIHRQAPQQSMQPQQHLQVMSAPQQPVQQQQAIQPHHSIQSQQPVQQQQPILRHQHNTAAAAHTANITAANVTEHHFIITAACPVTTHYNTGH